MDLPRPRAIEPYHNRPWTRLEIGMCLLSVAFPPFLIVLLFFWAVRWAEDEKWNYEVWADIRAKALKQWDKGIEFAFVDEYQKRIAWGRS